MGPRRSLAEPENLAGLRPINRELIANAEAIAKVEHHQGELFPRIIVTNLSMPSRAVVRFYNKRGTAQQWIKAGRR